MSLKEKLLKLRESILSVPHLGSRDYEFNGELESHPIGDQDTYRLYYLNYHRINEYEGNRSNNVGVLDFPLSPFKLPEGMSREDAFKVLSYLTDDVERQPGIEPFSLKAVKTLNGILDLERFGFKKVKEKDEDKILNLFTLTGRILLFKNSKLYPKYFEWYTEGVSKEEVQKIYAKLGIEFEDVFWLNTDEVVERPKAYEKKFESKNS